MERFNVNQNIYFPKNHANLPRLLHEKTTSSTADSEVDEIYPMAGIAYPGMHDVIYGHGGEFNHHSGNHRFRHLLTKYKLQYLTATKSEKTEILKLVVHTWRSLNPPGRFLTSSSKPSLGNESYWHDIGDKKAREKAAQCLRLKAPEFMAQLHSRKGYIEKQTMRARDDDTKLSCQRLEMALSPDALTPGPPVPDSLSNDDSVDFALKETCGHANMDRTTAKSSIPHDDSAKIDYYRQHVPSTEPCFSTEGNPLQDLSGFEEEPEDTRTTNDSIILGITASSSWVRSVHTPVDSDGAMFTSAVLNGASNDGHSSAGQAQMLFGKEGLVSFPELSLVPDKIRRLSSTGRSKDETVSLLSDLTGFSSVWDHKGLHSTITVAERRNSVYSAMSEITYLSEGMED